MQPLNYSSETFYGTASNFMQGMTYSIALDMKEVKLIVMSFNSQ
jgi:hypothetical protein